jgi:hypothetical protein
MNMHLITQENDLIFEESILKIEYYVSQGKFNLIRWEESKENDRRKDKDIEFINSGAEENIRQILNTSGKFIIDKCYCYLGTICVLYYMVNVIH